MKVQEIFPVSVVETNDALKEASRDRGSLYFRLAISPSGDENNLSDEQKALLSKLSETAKEITLKGMLKREISNVFPASILSDYIDGVDDIAPEDLTDEIQEDYVSQISEILKAEKGFLFTYFTFSVSELLKGTEYSDIDKLYTENGSIVRQRNNLYFGFFDDEEEAFGFMRSRLIQDIEDEKLLLDNPNVEEKPEKPSEKPSEKPKLHLRRK